MIALKKMWKKDYFKTIVAVALIAAVVLGFFYGLKLGLQTSNPLLIVESGSMSIPYDANDYNLGLTLTHPFDRTLSVGDIIIVQGVNIKDLKTNYPNSDIIIFHSPIDGELIVHRIIGTEAANGTIYFQTKGDGNGNVWPQTPQKDLDPWDYNNPPGVPQNLILGKVIMRIPWFGWITLFLRDTPWGLPLVIAIILLVAVVEFVIPLLREKSPKELNDRAVVTDNPI